MFKLFGIPILLFSLSQIYAKTRQKATNLLKCLAREEQNIHEYNHGGPLYKLNQNLVNQVVLLNNIKLKAPWLMKVCHAPHSPTLVLLEGYLTEGQQIFDLPEFSNTNEYMVTMASLKHFNRVVRRLALEHLATIQSQMPSATCLEGSIPSVAIMYEDYRYIEKHLSEEKLLGPRRARAIFKKIRDVEKLKKKCRPKTKVGKAKS